MPVYFFSLAILNSFLYPFGCPILHFTDACSRIEKDCIGVESLGLNDGSELKMESSAGIT